jgi:hypothetical protein
LQTTAFYNLLPKSWRPVLVVEEENHRPWASNW